MQLAASSRFSSSTITTWPYRQERSLNVKRSYQTTGSSGRQKATKVYMMSLIVCISCVKKKRSEPSKVADLYVSSLFTFALRYAKSLNPDHIFVLSAKHGLLSLNDEIPPYEQTLNNMPKFDRIKWANLVLGQLKNHADLENDKFVFLAGDKYRNLLVPHIKNYSVPMLGMGLGKQIQWLKGQVDQ